MPNPVPLFHLAADDSLHFGPHMPPQDFNALVGHEARVIGDVVQMTQTDFLLAAHGNAQSAAALPGDMKALQMNAQAFVQVDHDIQHHAPQPTLAHDYQGILAAEHFTVPLAAGGEGNAGDLMNEYAQITHILTHDFFLA